MISKELQSYVGKFNPRYVLFAFDNKHTPEEQMAIDREKENMFEFIGWISLQWDNFAASLGHKKMGLSEQTLFRGFNQREFDEFLVKKFDKP